MLTFSTIRGSGDIKVLNVALLLESAQDQFYNDLLLRLTTGGNSAANLHIPGLNLPAHAPDVTVVQTLRQVEHDHRDLISTTLALDAFTPPSFHFRFETLSRRKALSLALQVEQTASRAYLGLLGRLASPAHATLLASLQGTESRHVAILTILTNTLYELSNSPISSSPSGREPALNPDAALRFFSAYALV